MYLYIFTHENPRLIRWIFIKFYFHNFIVSEVLHSNTLIQGHIFIAYCDVNCIIYAIQFILNLRVIKLLSSF